MRETFEKVSLKLPSKLFKQMNGVETVQIGCVKYRNTNYKKTVCDLAEAF